MANPVPSYLKGALFGLSAALIWAGWSVATRFAVTTELSVLDEPLLRFGVPAALLLPLVIRRGLALDRLGWSGLAILVVGGGAPYALLAGAGLKFAPAHDQAALNPGMIPLLVALFAMFVLGEKPVRLKALGLSLVLAGAVTIVTFTGAVDGAEAGGGWDTSRGFGQALCFAAAFLWAGFTIVLRRSEIDPLHAVALVSVGSMAFYAPIFAIAGGSNILEVPVAALLPQIFYQGVMVTLVSVVLYGKAVAALGAAGGAAFGALVPVLTALLAVPFLGEWPSLGGWAAIALVSTGVYLASGVWKGALDPSPDHARRGGAPS